MPKLYTHVRRLEMEETKKYEVVLKDGTKFPYEADRIDDDGYSVVVYRGREMLGRHSVTEVASWYQVPAKEQSDISGHIRTTQVFDPDDVP